MVAIGSAVWGWLVAEKNLITPEPETKQEINQQAEIYFYRTDGIYRVSSQDEKPEKIVETSYDQEMSYYFTPDFEIMGPDQNWLVYRDVLSKNKETNELMFGLVVFDMKEKKELLSVKDQNSSVLSLSVSPDKSKLIYVISRKDLNKTVSQGPENFYQELYAWNGTETEKILTENSGFFGVGLGIWLDNDHITIGKGYEGISYCKIDLNTATEIPTSCEGYGSSSYGGLDKIISFENGLLFGFHYEWSEVTGNRNSTKGIFKQAVGEARTYLNNEAPSEMVVSIENIYYLRSNIDSAKYIYNGVDSDIYLLTKDGSMTKRLTNDGNSIMAKSHLNLSKDQRFLSYQITDLSKVNTLENTVESTQKNSTLWIYDTQLNKYYQVAENGLAPKLVVRAIEN
jgi:hypothetical protein